MTQTESSRSLVDRATDEQLGKLARRFLSRTLEHGFMSLSKKDLDLLLYFEMEQAGIVDPNSDNHSAARDLKLTPAKVLTIRREAYARWATKEEVLGHLRNTLERALSTEILTVTLEENDDIVRQQKRIPLVLEHPADKAEVEQLIKKRGGSPRYARNREVLLVRVEDILEVANAVTGGEPAKKAKQQIRAALLADASLKGFLTKDIRELSWEETRAVLNNTISVGFEKASTDGLARLITISVGGLFL